MIVKTDYTGCEYITAGKEYDARNYDGVTADITTDDGDNALIFLPSTCTHLDEIGTWTVVDE